MEGKLKDAGRKVVDDTKAVLRHLRAGLSGKQSSELTVEQPAENVNDSSDFAPQGPSVGTKVMKKR